MTNIRHLQCPTALNHDILVAGTGAIAGISMVVKKKASIGT